MFFRTAAAVAAALSINIAPAAAHKGHDHGDGNTAEVTAGGERAQRLADGTLYVPLPVQRIFGVCTLLTVDATFHRSMELPGRIIPDPNAERDT